MLPLELDLAAGNRNETGAPRTAHLSPGERVTAIGAFGVHAAKVVSDRADRGRLRAEPFELGVVQVAGRAAPQHCLREKSLPPQGNEPGRVQILRMQRPETHVSSQVRDAIRS